MSKSPVDPLSAVETGSQSHYFQVNARSSPLPSHARLAFLTPVRRKKAAVSTLGTTCWWNWGVLEELLALFFFATPALNKTADWCMIGEEPLGVIIKKEHMHVNQRELHMKEGFIIACIVFPDMLHMGETIPVRCLETVLKCWGTCSLIHPRGLSAHRLQHSFWRGCRAGNRPGKGSRKTSVCG